MKADSLMITPIRSIAALLLAALLALLAIPGAVAAAWV